jgi:hypothetical protein
MTNSHVFVTMGSLTNIACDAWLLPTDKNLTVEQHWSVAVPQLSSATRTFRNTKFSSGSVLAAAAENWPHELPLPVFTAVPLHGIASAADLLPALRDFMVAAADQSHQRRADHAGKDARQSRPNPLLAVPLFGTGAGGARLVRGEVMELLLEESRMRAAELGVDVVLVLQNKKDFALAQQLRKRSSKDWWGNLDQALQDRASELAARAQAGQLVPFMGSGISVSAGAPTWHELIGRLAARTDLTGDEITKLRSRNILDQAGILRAVFDDGRSRDGLTLNVAIAEEVKLDRYGLAPALLASLPCSQAITLNYDSLFETAAKDAGTPRTIIPHDTSAVSDSWLLKLHGSVSHPDSIVLTRDDYLGYNTNRSALSALVKATLITHHLLFVGFGLADDHFHEIVHDVRRALPEGSREDPTLATALTLFNDVLDERVWKDKLTLIPMSNGLDGRKAARTLEIFLDMLLAFATDSHSYLLADGYLEALTLEEASVRSKLQGLRASLTAEEISSSGGARVLGMLGELGASFAKSRE